MRRPLRWALPAILACLASGALASGDPSRSVIFQTAPIETLDALVVEDQRESMDRKKRAKPPSQRFRESLAQTAAPAGVEKRPDGSECLRSNEGARPYCLPPAARLAPEFSRFAPYGAMTAFRSGAAGFGQ